MESKLLIPTKLKVGYNNRADTYTGKLAFIIYYDTKNKLRQEKSWEGWRDKKIPANEFDNVPIEGFVINRNVGGASRYRWDSRIEKVRIFDPRGFEFEITTPNLLFILQETNSIKGKGLDGEFVLSWSGTQVVLLPTCSEEYKSSTNFTAIQSNKVLSKELVEGGLYQSKQLTNLIYLGKKNVYQDLRYSWGTHFSPASKHVFYNTELKDFECHSDLSLISSCISDAPNPEYADIVSKLEAKDKWGKLNSISTSPKQIKFVERYSYDFTHMKGEGYINKRKPIKTIQKVPDAYYCEIEPGVFQKYFLQREIKIIKDENSNFRIKWEHVGFQLQSSSKLVFENNELVVKSAVNNYKGKNLTKEELGKIPFVSITVNTRKGKSYIIK